jgi:hypothetical protein
MPVVQEMKELLQRWQELHELGREVSAEDLCPDQPDLAAKLSGYIRDLQKGEATPPPQTVQIDTDDAIKGTSPASAR